VHVSWDNVTVTPAMALFHRTFAADTESGVLAAGEALKKIETMGRLARGLDIPYDYKFHLDTFTVFSLCRRLLYGACDENAAEMLKALVEEYEMKYPWAYRFNLEMKYSLGRTRPSRLLKAVIREGREYRLIDRLLFNPLTIPLYLLAFRLMQNRLPKFVNRQGMPVKALFS